MVRARQVPLIEGTEQELVAEIESAADKYNKKGALVEAAKHAIKGVKDELTNAESALIEVVFANVARVAVTKGRHGEQTLTYKRSGYKVVVSEGSVKVSVKMEGATKEGGEPRRRRK